MIPLPLSSHAHPDWRPNGPPRPLDETTRNRPPRHPMAAVSAPDLAPRVMAGLGPATHDFNFPSSIPLAYQPVTTPPPLRRCPVMPTKSLPRAKAGVGIHAFFTTNQRHGWRPCTHPIHCYDTINAPLTTTIARRTSPPSIRPTPR